MLALYAHHPSLYSKLKILNGTYDSVLSSDMPNLLTLSRLSSLSALLRNRTALIIGSHEGARSTLFTNGNTAIPQPPMGEGVDSCARVRKVPRGVFADRLLNLAVNQIKKQKAINGPSAQISEPSVEAQGKATYSVPIPIPEGNITLSDEFIL